MLAYKLYFLRMYCQKAVMHVHFIVYMTRAYLWENRMNTLVAQQLLKNVFKTFQNGWVSVEMWGFFKGCLWGFVSVGNFRYFSI